jgi:hypothetical protein
MGIKLLALLLFPLLIIIGSASASVYIDVEGAGRAYAPGSQYLDANLTVIYNEFVPKTSWLYIYFNEESIARGSVSLDRYLHDESYYTFQNQTFNYNITAEGTIRWFEYPTQNFWYIFSVEGLCGGDWCVFDGTDICECPCSPPYPCKWSLSRTGFMENTVNGDPDVTGLKHIVDASGYFGIPPNTVNGSLIWNVQKSGSSPPEVELSMRAICGRATSPVKWYDNHDVWNNGWVITLPRYLSSPSNPCTDMISGTTNCRMEIMPFDEISLNQGYRKFGGPDNFPGGGIYKTDNFVTNEYQRRYADVEWNGTSGEIILRDFDPNAYYTAVYLPPNGPMICAYTSYKISKSSPWSGAFEEKGASAGYLNPYVRDYTVEHLESLQPLKPPQCPITNQQGCSKGDTAYDAVESYDPSDSVTVSFEESNLTVTGTAYKKIFAGNESFDVVLSDFEIDISSLTQELGNHTMKAVITDGEIIYKEQSFGIFTCEDGDGDGYCIESGDCNDTNPDQNPGLPEVCNGRDDNCNGQIDEGIIGLGEQLGKPCNNWPGSLCEGVYVCTSDGLNITCKSERGIEPGELDEICDNNWDDDCDGSINEDIGDIIDGIPQPPCVKDGDVCYSEKPRPCGPCKDGLRRCINGQWGSCEGASKPGIEVCNQKDDDCDGVIDNIGGKTSIEETQCRCYNGGSPTSEISFECNEIDDNCNEQIDEGIFTCCPDGKTRTCGTDVGICEFGIQVCQGGGWGPCSVGDEPKDEICCNNLDDDCNGQVDEFCPADACQGGDDLSMLYWVMIGLGLIILAAVFIYTGFIKKTPAEPV